ncbi:nad-dependent epimerase/dehydratase, putative [Heliomicrobium modesticaldum Ice1]|uniref:Nad-dependent epimerase/dehydratase, putative n=1 Tax=Heliobacterium modesticaldum (strain ATCC 51547 / Ice1) TaxID=498761 RepID=B0TH02_HELMI|nr:NAD-dependent epimerase/dehydratase family protein [Heliomicrobium modesticaldum]ABZ83327.1 nad-dependent epimerase/dehydratase, putative [Heliomicrobium modesticaldum Ice1]
MNILVTGGAGFIGRWVVLQLLRAGHHVWVVDDLSNGRAENLAYGDEALVGSDSLADPCCTGIVTGTLIFEVGDICDRERLRRWFEEHRFDLCYHLAAEINVQKSIDFPADTFRRDVEGTFGLLELCREFGTRFVFMSTCMVYAPFEEAAADRASRRGLELADGQGMNGCGYGDGGAPAGIDERHPVLPASPYAGAKLSGEHLALSYYHAYGLPVTVIRPFNTYGPYQKTNGEGGVVAIFVERALREEPLHIFGDGTQTRDLLYVEDCARFVIQAGMDRQAIGKTLNAGSGRDVSINELARLVGEVVQAGPGFSVCHVAHPHPQSEIRRLLCDFGEAKRLLGWEPQVSLEEGIARTADWIQGKQ